MSNTQEPIPEPQGTFAPDDLPLQPDPDLVVPMDSLSYVAQEDWDINTAFPNFKHTYEEMSAYVRRERQAKVDEYNALMTRVHNVEMSLAFVPPEAARDLMAIIQEHRNQAQTLQDDITAKDEQLGPHKEEMKNNLIRWSSVEANRLQALILEHQWPDPHACMELELPYQFQRFWYQTPQGPSPNVQEGRGETPLVAELLRRIQDLEREKASWRRNEGPEIKVPLAKPESSQTAGENQTRLKEKTILERRKRARIPHFDQGSVDEAQKWINSYESICKNFLEFSDQEIIDELYAALQGRAGTWFNSLTLDNKKEWRIVKEKFLHQFGGGARPATSAFTKLKSLKQGNMPISEFVSLFQDLINRAQIFAPDMQLGYFKDGVRPELCDAILFARARDLDTAIEVVTEAEREWKNKGRYRLTTDGRITATWANSEPPKAYGSSSSGNSGSENAGEPQQNAQRETRECFYCHKPGHLKVDCRKRKKDLNERGTRSNYKDRKGYKQNNSQQVDEQEMEVYSQDSEELDVFAHFLNNSQEIRNEQESLMKGHNTNAKRIKMNISVEDQEVQALVDTGSTFSSIDQETRTKLGLEEYTCDQITIKYGNNSTQTSNTKAKMEFWINEKDKSTADLYVVDSQNESIILGFDWMYEEDIMIRPKTKTVFKAAQENCNSSEAMEEIIHQKFPKLVEESEKQSLTTAPYEHFIDTGEARPVAMRDYRRSEIENQHIQQEVEKMLKSGVIVPSNSDWCSPVVLIDKPDGSKRFCVDYRRLNQVTIKDKYPLPRITELLDKLNGCQYLSTIDLKSGYWQLKLDSSSARKTAFIANGSLYEFTSLPFGVVNGPSSFMRLMHMVLRGMKNTLVYLDDVICFSKTKEEHEKNLEELLKRLDKFNLKISLKKCQFFQKEVKFLGFLVGGSGIRSDPEKVEVVKNWPVPKDVKGLQKFLGFCAFYHRFIANLSDIAKPLNTLLKKEVKPFSWTTEANRAFNILKDKMVTLPTLAYPNPALPYDLHTDASNIGLGIALVQSGRPVAFASKTLSPAERNYSTTEKECLAIVWALNYFYPYLYGAVFTIYTDHAALKSILSTKMPRGRIARWILAIQVYQFTVVHRKGSMNADADALSRLPEETQNSQALEDLTIEEFQKMQTNDSEISLLKKDLKEPYKVQRGTVCYQRKEGKLVPVVPNALKKKVIARYHDGTTGGHFGVEKTIEKIKTIAHWNTMKEDVKEYIRCCHNCQIYKIRNDSTVPPMKPILPRYTGDIWAMDVAELPESNRGNKYILVFVEYLTKWAITVPLASVTTDRIVEVLLFEIVLKFSVPTRIISDNGSNMVSDAMQMVCKRIGIKRSLTSVEHPQTDGLVERINRTIKTSLAAYTGVENKDSWDSHLPFVTFAYNTAKQASTGFSPFEVMFGRKVVLPLTDELIMESKTYETETWMAYLNEHLPLITGTALENIKKAQDRQKKFYDKHSTVKYDYKDGDLVLTRNLLKTGFPKARWIGPWKILGKNNQEGTSYKVKKCFGKNQHESTANVRHMRPYHEPTNSSSEEGIM